MATSRTYPSPVNLKERIAALQQRNVSPSQQQTSQFAAKNIPSSGTGGLRDKIAKFEEKGGIPVPRGSFGTGVPQLPENAPAKKRGELYGNRIQGFGRPIGTPPSRSCSPLPPADDSPSPRKRCVSTGGALLKGTPPRSVTDEPAPPLPPVLSLPSARRNSLAVDFGPAKHIVVPDTVSPSAGEDSESPSLSPSLRVGEASGIVTPSQSPPEPFAPLNDALPRDVNVLSLAEKESEVAEFTSQDDFNPASVIAPDMTTTSQSSLEAIPVAEATSTIELDQTDGPSLDELSQTSYHSTLSADESVSDTQPLEAALPGSSSTTTSSFVTPNTSTECDSTLSHPLLSTPDTSEFTAVTNMEEDNAAESVPASEPSTAEERGTISISVLHVQPSPSSPGLNTETTNEIKHSFKAVVHRKITEKPAAAAPTSTLFAPSTPQIARVQHLGITVSAEVPFSPGYGELTTLLEEAALLEKKLTEGDISTPSQPQVSLPKTPTSATFAPDVRTASSSTLTEHVKAPSTESPSLSECSVSIPSILEPNFGNIPEEDEIDGRSLASTSASHRSPSHKKYLSSIRRLTGRRSSNYMPGAYPRDSISTCSEDSAALATPSEHDDGSRDSFGIAWPSVSPKKGGMGRTSSFADKLFNRNRTRSNVSTAETDQGSIYTSSTRSFTLSQPPSPSATKNSPSRHAAEVQGSRSSPWTISRESSSSPCSSILDKEIFDAFPSVPQTLPSGPVHLSPDLSEAAVRRLSTMPVKSRKLQQPRISMV